MAIKYTRREPHDSKGDPHAVRRFERYTSGGPSRRPLWLVIGGTTLVIVLLSVMNSVQQRLRAGPPLTWYIGDIVAVYSPADLTVDDRYTLRVRLPETAAENNAIDIFLDESSFQAFEESAQARIGVFLNNAGAIQRIVEVEPVPSGTNDAETVDAESSRTP